MNQDWFEMAEIRRRKFANAVWIPLRACKTTEDTGKSGHAGYKSEFFGTGTLGVPEGERLAAEKIGWSDIGMIRHHSGGIQDGEYITAEEFRGFVGDFAAINIVLDQRGDSFPGREWHLNQDYVITLGLMREGDIWVRPEEGYVEVARLHRNEAGLPILMETRAAHLRDYLCARNMALYMASYWEREEIYEDANHIKWGNNLSTDETDSDRWEGRITEIHEGGRPFGLKTAVFHVARTDVDPEEDVPTFGFPTDDKIESKSWTKEHEGKKLNTVEGALWRNEWIEPAAKSPIIRGDEVPPTAYFIVDSEGNQENRETLTEHGRWIWFRPDVVPALAHRRGGSLRWHTRDTGSVAAVPNCSVHFGVNSLGLINVYAKDIALLPDWQQKLWAGYNLSPEGKVSGELLDSQMRAVPANTKAPEILLAQCVSELEGIVKEKFGVTIIRDHDQISDIMNRTHRFRATSVEGFLALAKDLARLTAERIDAKAIQKIVKPPEKTNWGSLKSLEKLLATIVEADQARAIMGPLFGINELRQLDAHLASDEASAALKLANVDEQAPFVVQGYQLLFGCVDTVSSICSAFEAKK